MRLSKVLLAFAFFFSLLNSTETLAQKLIVGNYKHLPTDISAREYEVMDINDEPCAIIKIYTGFKGLKVDGNRGVEKTEQKDGSFWVWVPNGTRQIKISLDGYPMLPHYFSSGLKSSNVYSIELNSDQLFAITINTYQLEADVMLKDKKHKSNKPIENLAEGKYPVMITKLGYKTVYDTITVNAKSIFFSYELERTKQAIMKVKTNPTAALILIDGEVVGNSPFQGHYFPGEHRVQISKDDHATLDTTIMFDPDKGNEFNFNLRKNVGWVQVATFPSGAKITIDGKPTTSPIVKLNADKNHELLIQLEYYRDFNEVFRVNSNDTTFKSVPLKLAEGQLSYITEPQNTNITIIDRHKEKRSWQGNKVMDLPTGKYELEAKVKGYKKYETEFTISKDKKEYLTYNMEAKGFSHVGAGVLSIILPGAGQFYTQRNKVGAAFLTTTLAAAAATGYFYGVAEIQAIHYKGIRKKYTESTEPNDIDGPDGLRETMLSEHKKYSDLIQQRDMVQMVAIGLYGLNILDAIIFAKYYDPNKAKKKDTADKLKFNLGPSPNMKGGGFYLSYKF